MEAILIPKPKRSLGNSKLSVRCGKVNGGRIHGEYPDDLTAKGPLNVGRGRLIPTRGWESVWHGIAEWMGVEQDEMDSVIPNKKYFPSNLLFKATDLFRQ